MSEQLRERSQTQSKAPTVLGPLRCVVTIACHAHLSQQCLEPSLCGYLVVRAINFMFV